ncbi:YidH family protein [Geodermatophilus sp. SYSU D00703]
MGEGARPGSGSRPRGRFPRAVYGRGEEPDPRFSLANERTFLAWIRTSLALAAGGVALEALDVPPSDGLRLACVLVLVALGVLAPLQAWWGWVATERAMRLRRPLPAPRLSPVIAAGTLAAGVLLLLGIVLG